MQNKSIYFSNYAAIKNNDFFLNNFTFSINHTQTPQMMPVHFQPTIGYVYKEESAERLMSCNYLNNDLN